MHNSVKERLLFTAIAVSVLWLVCMGWYLLLQVLDARSAALSECIKNDYNLFRYCYIKTTDEVHLSAADFLKPFIPSALMIWIFWILKIELQVEENNVKKKLVKTIVISCYLIAAIAVFVPLYLVAAKEDASKLNEINWNGLFVFPWLGITWISAPIIYQQLADRKIIISEFKKLRLILWIVVASPLVAIILIFLRDVLKF